mmetsp:Transcript_2128/g.6444  ORF Transcript_2128/g.6444 Transcript_2128/m.6444 type:complete len:235 (-) Transcript_2128:1392-2096(-)
MVYGAVRAIKPRRAYFAVDVSKRAVRDFEAARRRERPVVGRAGVHEAVALEDHEDIAFEDERFVWQRGAGDGVEVFGLRSLDVRVRVVARRTRDRPVRASSTVHAHEVEAVLERQLGERELHVRFPALEQKSPAARRVRRVARALRVRPDLAAVARGQRRDARADRRRARRAGVARRTVCQRPADARHRRGEADGFERAQRALVVRVRGPADLDAVAAPADRRRRGRGSSRERR